jgi:type I restriction enzyme S subunit
MENGKFALASRLIGGRAAGSTEFHVLRSLSGLEPKFVLYFLLQGAVRHEARIRMKGAAGQLRVPPEYLSDLSFPLPPTGEQRQIVAEIDKQFTRQEAGVTALKRVQANLKRYRAAVLKAAVEGRLVPTEAELAAREGRSFETSAEFLQRILAERRARWEADQLAKFRASGKIPKDDKWKGKYPEPETPDTAKLPTLPEGWTWATLSQLSEIQGGIQKQPSRRPARNPFPFLRVANVLRGRLDLCEVHEIELFEGELERLRLKTEDLLIVEGNGSPSEIGRMAIWKGEIENCVHQNHIIRARLLAGVSSPYVAAYWNSPEGTARILDVASSTSGLYTLSVSKVSRLPVPLAPNTEQHGIIVEVERRLSIIDELQAQVEASLKRADRLRQSVLKRAFEGKLVRQDPSDEPAAVLLERIRSQRENSARPFRKIAARAEVSHA